MSMLTAMAALMMTGGAALADDPPSALCSIQDWRHWHVADRERLYIEGRATCENGKVTIFAYAGPSDTRQFLGADRVTIREFAFKAKFKPVRFDPEGLTIEYMVLEQSR